MNITLIGYRGTGKSTVARLLAGRLGWDWVDADACVEERANRTISEIFAAEGEQGFRDRESALINELTARDRIVIAAGGGAVLKSENRLAIRQSGFVVWLVASPQVIHQRITSDPASAHRRPPLTHFDAIEEIHRLLVQREPLYRECADLVVDSEHQSPEQVAQQIFDDVRVTRPSSRME